MIVATHSNMNRLLPTIRPKKKSKSILQLAVERYQKTNKFVTSKPARIVLVWSFLMTVVYSFVSSLTVFHISSYYVISIQINLVVGSIYNSVIHLIYPLAGVIADLKIGRHKNIVASIWILVVTSPFALLGSGLITTGLQFYINSVTYLVLLITGGILAGTGLILMICCTTAFNANAVQFGLDQLHDSSTEEQLIFIQWFAWVYYAATVIFDITTRISDGYITESGIFYLNSSMLSVIAISLIITMYFAHNTQHWCIFNTKLTNPYKLVYQVTRFSRIHKVPVRRSALTYCEDIIPTGLDLAKTKYGDTYTTEQVEDVKAFYGILRVLCSVGPIYFLEFAAHSVTDIFKPHILKDYYYYYNYFNEHNTQEKIKNLFEGFLIYDIMIILLPIYIIFIRPLVSYYIPRTRIRMGIGIVSMIVTLAISLGMEIIGHYTEPNLKCMFSSNPFTTYLEANSTYTSSPVVASFYYIILFQLIISKIFSLIFLIAKYEFILAQSPNAMKGLIIGLSYAIEGVFNILGALFIIPFVFYWTSSSYPSCGTIYYSLTICIGLVTFVIFIYISGKYQNRIRDEPCRVHQYVEEYYSKVIENY